MTLSENETQSVLFHQKAEKKKKKKCAKGKQKIQVKKTSVGTLLATLI